MITRETMEAVDASTALDHPLPGVSTQNPSLIPPD
jgi:hypothetical protein